MSKWRLGAVAAVGLVTASVLTACSDSTERRSLTGPTALAVGGALGAEAEADLTPAAGTRDVPAAGATTLTFDDLTKAPTAKIHNGYGGGLHWTDVSVVDPIAYGQSVTGPCIPPSYFSNGYVNGRVSGKYVAYRQGGGPTPGEVTAPAGWTFDFISAYFTAANDKEMKVSGYKNGVLLYEQTFDINCDTPTLFEANYQGVDRVVFSSRFGTGGYSTLGDTYAMDNFTYKKNLPARPASTPLSLLLLGTGLAHE